MCGNATKHIMMFYQAEQNPSRPSLCKTLTPMLVDFSPNGLVARWRGTCMRTKAIESLGGAANSLCTLSMKEALPQARTVVLL